MSQRKAPLPKIRIGELLLQKGFINATQLNQALDFQRNSELKLGEILIHQGLISPEQLQQVLNEQRLRNLVTSVLLSVSALTPNLPQLIADNGGQTIEVHKKAIPTQTHLSENDSQEQIEQQHQGGTPIQASLPKAQTLFASANPLPQKPTVEFPLRGFCHPLNGEGWLSQGIRGRTHQGRMEYAYDLAVSIGTPIYAMRSGKVIAVRDKYPDTGGGKENATRFNFVWIEHEDGYRSAYVHLQQGFRSKVDLKAGDHVEAGQLIGYSGNSGWSSGPHLHVEVQKPYRRQRFTKTVPFSISGSCKDVPFAQKG
ncbi:peptidoglycan DD-metalloendopeptidase family protein (plasmid) [Acaryochloris sp. 'Moss Beach']|uniref:M23 family metallopeptidase n=1 Tax=Acaryochloris sp. 'Moss Beach' TaxID=2740837 RepID=UPI001F1BF9EC|nr:M23 family metallopeptidase [Acaryochloris sp. 'Moss Beach']UJB72448.1 peptidoglycan DD-metalloendopeptidase family protein [Acaryochloris sp. 'Moss Beach']